MSRLDPMLRPSKVAEALDVHVNEVFAYFGAQIRFSDSRVTSALKPHQGKFMELASFVGYFLRAGETEMGRGRDGRRFFLRRR